MTDAAASSRSLRPAMAEAAMAKEEAFARLNLAAPLARLAEAAVDRALGCVGSLGDRADDADFDRGARAAECLMRVARSAADLRGQLHKDALAHEQTIGGDAHGDSATDRFEQEAGALAERLAVELGRTKPIAADAGATRAGSGRSGESGARETICAGDRP